MLSDQVAALAVLETCMGAWRGWPLVYWELPLYS